MSSELETSELQTPLWAASSDIPGAAISDIPGAARAILAELSIEEKCWAMTGADLWHSYGVPRLQLPGLRTSDGPHGCRGFYLGTAVGSAAVPCEAALASSFDKELIRRVGELLAGETRRNGANVLLGPTINLHRLPLSGRFFECFSEDPYLSARCAVAYINGVQSRGVACVAKHFLANELEDRRATMTAEMADEPLRELYLPPFEAAVVEAKVAGIMTGYNRFQGVYCAQNSAMLQGILRDEWGFDGFVVSDWYGNHSTVESCNAGLNLEMPGFQPIYYGERLAAAVHSGDVSEEVLNERCRPVLEAMVRQRHLQEPDVDQPHPMAPCVRDLCREAAAAGCVLLKNNADTLPLLNNSDSSAAAGSRTLAVLGANAQFSACQGGGSARVIPPVGVANFLQSLRARCADRGVAVRFEAGEVWQPSYTPANACLQGCDLGGMKRARGGGYQGMVVDVALSCFAGFSRSRLGNMIFPAGKRLKRSAMEWMSPVAAAYSSAQAAIVESESESLPEVHNNDNQLQNESECSTRSRGGEGDSDARFVTTPAIESAAAAAAAADFAVVVVGTDGYVESEGADQLSMRLPGRQDALISAVARARRGKGRWAVVLNCGSPKDLRAWIKDADVPAVLLTWFGGQEMGPAVADVLLGDLEPGGRLPCTWPLSLKESPAVVYGGWPGVDPDRQVYEENVLLGYRSQRRPKGEVEPAAPLFEFGFGLSYAGPYTYFGLDVTPVPVAVAAPQGRSKLSGTMVAMVKLGVRNEGQRPGREVVQLYVRPVQVPGVVRPERGLCGFHKTATLKYKAEELIEFRICARDLAFWRSAGGSSSAGAVESLGMWAVAPGCYSLLVGASSADVRLESNLTIGVDEATALTESLA